MILSCDLNDWFDQPLVCDDEGERQLRAAAKAFAEEVLNTTGAGHDQEHAVMRIRETCALIAASRRTAARKPAQNIPA